MSDLLVRLAQALPFSLLTIGLLVVLIVLLLAILVVRRLRRQAEAREAAGENGEAGAADDEAAPVEAGPRRLHRSFRQAERALASHHPDREERLSIPHVVLLGPPGSRPRQLLGTSDLPVAFSRPAPDPVDPEGDLSWWFFYQGVVLDLGGDHVLPPAGRDGGGRSWKSFLRLLERHRPERPLDGVVVTLPVTDLLAGSAPAPGEQTLEEKADRLYDRLKDVHQRLGMRVPVYVLITGCERLRGFSGFSGALARQQDAAADGAPALPQMLGWSSPYGTDAAYQSAWVGRAFGELSQGLDAAQAELYARADETVERPDEVFLFPLAVRLLEEPLRRVLDSLFRSSVYHGPLLFRGFYLTGQSGAAEPGGERPGHFLRDLFERKVFPEGKLAEPLPDSFLSRNRRVLTAQIALAAASLLLVCGTWLAWAGLEGRNDRLEPFFEEVAADVAQVRELRRTGEIPEPAEVRERVSGLLEKMSSLDARPYRALFLPSSWGSRFSDELRDALILTYDEVLFKAMFHALDRRAAQAVHGDAPVAARSTQVATWDRPAGERSVTPPQDTLEMRTLRGYVGALVRLERHGQTYNRLQQTQSLEELAGLLEYLFDTRVPPSFFEDSTLYREALAEVEYQPFEPARWQPDATGRAATLTTGFYERLFRHNPLTENLAVLEQSLERAAQGEPVNVAEPDPLPGLRALLALLRQVDSLLDEEGLEWVFLPSFLPSREFEEVVGEMETSEFFGRDIAGRVRRAGQSNFEILSRSLARYGAELTGPFLVVEAGRAQNRLAEPMVVLEGALGGFLDQSFVGGAAADLFAARVPEGRRLLWDETLLADALALWEPYDRFHQQGLMLFPPQLQPAVDRIAREQVGERMAHLVARAQRFPTFEQLGGYDLELGVASQAENLELVRPQLVRLTQIFDDLDIQEYRRSLAGVVHSQGLRLLGDVDDLLTRSRLYLPKDDGFAWWDGEAPLARAAYALADDTEIDPYLGRQRGRIEELAEHYARPALTVMAETRPAAAVPASPLYRRWRDVVQQLADQRDGKAGNSVTALEELLRTDLPSLRLQDCLPKTAGALAGGEQGDFFTERRRELASRLHRRCYALAGERAAEAWGEIEQLFRRQLAGRFPFSRETNGLGAANAHEASPAAVAALLRKVAGVRPLIDSVPADHPAFAGSGGEIHAFLDDLEALGTFLAPFLTSPDEGAVPVVGLQVDFRADRQMEHGGNQIIDWELSSGAGSVSARDVERKLPWRYGDDLALRLRWAKDSPWRPTAVVPASARSAAEDPGVVLYRYPDPWSLVSFVRTHQDPARPARAGEALPLPLRFQVQTAPQALPRLASDTVTMAPSPLAQVYLRLSLFHPETQEPLPLPCFPSEAPKLGQPRLDAESDWWCRGS